MDVGPLQEAEVVGVGDDAGEVEAGGIDPTAYFGEEAGAPGAGRGREAIADVVAAGADDVETGPGEEAGTCAGEDVEASVGLEVAGGEGDQFVAGF